MDLLNLKCRVQGLLSLQPYGPSRARVSGEGNNFHTSPYTESTCFTLTQAMVLHTSSKASPVAKPHQQSQRCLGSIHGTGPSCPAKQHGSPTHVLGRRGSLGRAPWRAGETPAAQHLRCMTSPRMPDNRQLPKTSEISCPAPSLQVQSCKPSLAAAYDSHDTQVSPQMQLMQMLFAMRGQHVV